MACRGTIHVSFKVVGVLLFEQFAFYVKPLLSLLYKTVLIVMTFLLILIVLVVKSLSFSRQIHYFSSQLHNFLHQALDGGGILRATHALQTEESPLS